MSVKAVTRFEMTYARKGPLGFEELIFVYNPL